MTRTFFVIVACASLVAPAHAFNVNKSSGSILSDILQSFITNNLDRPWRIGFQSNAENDKKASHDAEDCPDKVDVLETDVDDEKAPIITGPEPLHFGF